MTFLPKNSMFIVLVKEFEHNNMKHGYNITYNEI